MININPCPYYRTGFCDEEGNILDTSELLEVYEIELCIVFEKLNIKNRQLPPKVKKFVDSVYLSLNQSLENYLELDCAIKATASFRHVSVRNEGLNKNENTFSKWIEPGGYNIYIETKDREIIDFLIEIDKEYELKGKTPKIQLVHNLVTLTAKGYNTALQLHKQVKENEIGMQSIDDNFLNEIEYSDGKLVLKNNKYEIVTLKNAEWSNEIQELDLPLLRGLYSVIYQAQPIIRGNEITIKANTLANYLGINIRGDKGYDILRKIRQFDRLFGVMPDGSIYRVLIFSSYDKQTDTVTLDSGFMNELIRKSSEDYTKIKKKRGEETEYISPHHSFLIHSSIVKERNKNAMLIVEQLIILLQQGLQEMFIDKVTKKPIPIIQHISFNTLLERIPTFKYRIEQTNETTNKNKLLKSSFIKAYELLKTKTDAYKYYDDLNITKIVPTISILSEKILMEHRGKNKNYNN